MNERPDADHTSTLPPGKRDEAVSEFETLLRSRGENRARWEMLMALLSGEGEHE